MDAAAYTALLTAVSGRQLGDLGVSLGEAMAKYLPPSGINPPLRLAHFVAQTCEETGGYQWLSELGGPTYFAKYDPPGSIARNLGNTQMGDGMRFKGRGIIQLTGRSNYTIYGARLGIDLVNNPELAATPDVAVQIAVLYWTTHGLNALADNDDIVRITQRINGGLMGLSARKAALARAKRFTYAGVPMPSPPKKPVPVVGLGPVAVAAAPIAGVIAAQSHSPEVWGVVCAIALALSFSGLVFLILKSRKHSMASISDTATAVEAAATALNAAATELAASATAIGTAIANAGSSTSLDQPLADLAAAVTAVQNAATAIHQAAGG